MTELHIERSGVGAPLFLLHHGLGCTRDWDNVALHLAEHYDVIAYDRPGYGRSVASAPRDTLGEDAFERDAAGLIALLDRLEIDAAHLVGHSDGATIALIAAACWPARVRSLVVEAAHIYTEEISRASVQRVLGWGLRHPAGQEYLCARHGEHGPQVLRMFAAHWLEHTPPDWTLLPLIRTIRCPTLVIQGTLDTYGTTRQPHDIAATIPGAQLWLLDGVGHEPHVEAAEEYLAQVLTFLGRYSP
ncbi:MAG TPA: alpha/beta fold hydrolase [Roseiflexaceae bacterium]